MGRYARRKTLIPRIWLTFVAFCQVFLTPLVAFSITYLIQIHFQDDGFRFSFDYDMIPWIGAASLMYGMIALFLALIMGGFTPLRVVEKGGWRNYLGFSRVSGDASARRLARQKYALSPHARLTVLAHERWEDGHSILSTHGGLILLSVPFQVLLATVPLILVLLIPDSIMHEDRRLELSLLVYLFGLLATMKMYPKVAERYIGIASFTRRWLISMTKLSWLAPVLVLWLLGRVASVAVIGWMGPDLSLNIDIEKQLFESSLAINSIPETSFLDLLTALAVMPLAAFTTMAVLGAGSSDPPEWIYEYRVSSLKREPPAPSTPSLLSKGVGIAASTATTAAVLASTTVATHASSAVQSAVGMVSGASSVGGASTEFSGVADTVKSLDDVSSVTDSLPVQAEELQFDGISDLFDQRNEVSEISDAVQKVTSGPSHDEPAITGLGKFTE
ncbi:MAG: hypothetical protein CMA63_04080 [Euryarchaeota archaeon]|nr:hypothetical protein [Euryarchaeota archaeon]|tara:strand:- start:29351 stop:30688 length:1338 start_codon:yes stop_codon:yes gene_type:complete